MEYQNVSSRSSRRNQHHGHSTRPTKLAMRFFGSKQRGGKRDGGQQQQPPQAASKKKGVQGLLKSPASRGEKEATAIASLRSEGRRRAGEPEQSAHSKASNGSRAATPKPRQSPNPDKLPEMTLSRQQQGGGGAGEATKTKAPPPSILHNNMHPHSNFGSHPPPPPPTYDISPYAPGPTNPSRVRFMSAEASVASTECSAVHLMAGGANSVASSSAMSSSEGNRENVFDRVLNMVMAEEHERLNAMGFNRTPDTRS